MKSILSLYQQLVDRQKMDRRAHRHHSRSLCYRPLVGQLADFRRTGSNQYLRLFPPFSRGTALDRAGWPHRGIRAAHRGDREAGRRKSRSATRALRAESGPRGDYRRKNDDLSAPSRSVWWSFTCSTSQRRM